MKDQKDAENQGTGNAEEITSCEMRAIRGATVRVGSRRGGDFSSVDHRASRVDCCERGAQAVRSVEEQVSLRQTVGRAAIATKHRLGTPVASRSRRALLDSDARRSCEAESAPNRARSERIHPMRVVKLWHPRVSEVGLVCSRFVRCRRDLRASSGGGIDEDRFSADARRIEGCEESRLNTSSDPVEWTVSDKPNRSAQSLEPFSENVDYRQRWPRPRPCLIGTYGSSIQVVHARQG